MTGQMIPEEVKIDWRELRSRFDQAIMDFLGARATSFLDLEDAAPFLDELGSFVLAGGKRLRPLFCYWGFRAAGGEDAEEIYCAAASLELFHAFALSHDDVMDGSDTRRGRSTLHRVWERHHSDLKWRGDRVRSGAAMAVLTGDLLGMWSEEMFRRCGLPRQRVDEAKVFLEAMRSEVVIGQYLDLRGQAAGGSLASAFDVIRLKAARYTVQRPLQIGGALAGADRSLMEALAQTGELLGEAFQLRDDVLGVFGDPAITGKSSLTDLRDGKPTALLMLAKGKADTRQRRRIDELFGDPSLDEEGGQQLRDVIRDTGALARVEKLIERRAQAALAALNEMRIVGEARAALRALAVAATDRHI